MTDEKRITDERLEKMIDAWCAVVPDSEVAAALEELRELRDAKRDLWQEIVNLKTEKTLWRESSEIYERLLERERRLVFQGPKGQELRELRDAKLELVAGMQPFARTTRQAILSKGDEETLLIVDASNKAVGDLDVGDLRRAAELAARHAEKGDASDD